MLLEGTSQEVPGTSQDFHDLGLAMLLEGTSQDFRDLGLAMLLEGTSQDFRDLGLEECSYVTRGDIPGSPRDIPGLP